MRISKYWPLLERPHDHMLKDIRSAALAEGKWEQLNEGVKGRCWQRSKDRYACFSTISKCTLNHIWVERGGKSLSELLNKGKMTWKWPSQVDIRHQIYFPQTWHNFLEVDSKKYIWCLISTWLGHFHVILPLFNSSDSDFPPLWTQIWLRVHFEIVEKHVYLSLDLCQHLPFTPLFNCFHFPSARAADLMSFNMCLWGLSRRGRPRSVF